MCIHRTDKGTTTTTKCDVRNVKCAKATINSSPNTPNFHLSSHSHIFHTRRRRRRNGLQHTTTLNTTRKSPQKKSSSRIYYVCCLLFPPSLSHHITSHSLPFLVSPSSLTLSFTPTTQAASNQLAAYLGRKNRLDRSHPTPHRHFPPFGRLLLLLKNLP